MNDINQQRLYYSLTTPPGGIGAVKPSGAQKEQSAAIEGAEATKSFNELLRERMATGAQIEFSKHAAQRAQQRGIPLSAEHMQRLHEGVKIAEEKGLTDTLILVDSSAFIVNVKNNTVITAVDGASLKGNVFTNIDGTVII